MEGLKEANVARETDIYLANPVLPDEILRGLTINTERICFYFSFLWSDFRIVAMILSKRSLC